MTETAKFSVSGEEFIDELLEKNKELEEENKNLKDVGHIKKITELKKELNILKLRVERNDAIIDELLVAEEGTDIQGILEKEYEFSYFN